jgi:thiol-disulfide isomerase/thioredoxin
VELKLGQPGAVITGKVKLAGNVPADLDCTYSMNHLVSRSPGIAPPPEVAALGFDARKGWNDAWYDSPEGEAFLNTLPHWFVKLTPDGSFRISGVPPGDYDLAVRVYAKPAVYFVGPLVRSVVRVQVSEADAARGEMTLPEIAAEVKQMPAIGDTPSLDFKNTEGSNGSLADFRGHYTVVHFWATWWGTCKEQFPALKQLQERSAAQGLEFVGLSLDKDATVWRSALAQYNLPWKQGRLDAEDKLVVSREPAYWLLDPAGKIVAKASDVEELSAAWERVQGKSKAGSTESPVKNGR